MTTLESMSTPNSPSSLRFLYPQPVRLVRSLEDARILGAIRRARKYINAPVGSLFLFEANYSYVHDNHTYSNDHYYYLRKDTEARKEAGGGKGSSDDGKGSSDDGKGSSDDGDNGIDGSDSGKDTYTVVHSSTPLSAQFNLTCNEDWSN